MATWWVLKRRPPRTGLAAALTLARRLQRFCMKVRDDEKRFAKRHRGFDHKIRRFCDGGVTNVGGRVVIAGVEHDARTVSHE
jgi:hypothetical protein